MPITTKELKLAPINELKVNRGILIDSINANKLEWQYKKTYEECIELIDVLIHYEKGTTTPEQVCMEIADVYIQIGILLHLFPAPTIQSFIKRKLVAISNRNERKKKKLDKHNNIIGFSTNE